ncbi:MAG: bifunctional nuclease family protein [Flavobacteriales bacterium]|nr:bifunctional nuclease family protein [Flavobacteriales bacterium]
MNKIGLEIIGLSYSQTQSGAYALVLGEKVGNRRLPIIIGGFEAQAIAIELENMTPSRPLTHDLFKTFATTFDINIKEVLIYNLVEGIFFAKLICIKDGKEVEIDARTSDAIALAVRFNCPVFTFEFILSSAGIILDEESDSLEFETDNTSGESQVEMSNDNANDLTKKSVADLDKILNEALQKEDYERASIIRDEMNKRQSN